MYDAATELRNKRFEKHYDEYEKLLDGRKKKLDLKFNPINLKLEDYDYDGWLTEKESDDKTLESDKKENLDDLPPLEGDEEEEERK